MSYQSTLLPDYIGLVQNTSINFYKNSTNILDAFDAYLAEINECIEFEKAKVTPQPVESLGNLFNTLNSNNFIVPDFNASGEQSGIKKLDNTFQLYFIEKYQSLSKEYKALVDKLIDGNVYFKNFSDDVGNIADSVSVLDNNTSPYYDVYNAYYFNSSNLPPTLMFKVSKNELIISSTFSKYGDALLKRNLQGLQSTKKVLGVSVSVVNKLTAKTSHGENLITDILHYDRVILYQLSVLATLKTILGNLSGFILFYKLLNPKDQDTQRKSIDFIYQITNMEKLSIRVDALKKQLDKVELSTIQVMGNS